MSEHYEPGQLAFYLKRDAQASIQWAPILDRNYVALVSGHCYAKGDGAEKGGTLYLVSSPDPDPNNGARLYSTAITKVNNAECYGVMEGIQVHLKEGQNYLTLLGKYSQSAGTDLGNIVMKVEILG